MIKICMIIIFLCTADYRQTDLTQYSATLWEMQTADWLKRYQYTHPRSLIIYYYTIAPFQFNILMLTDFNACIGPPRTFIVTNYPDAQADQSFCDISFLIGEHQSHAGS